MSPQLSVIMPTRNRAAEVVRAAASVLGQDVDLELVVVDDASTDDTAGQLDALAAGDRRVRVVRPSGQVPLGPCLARNRGLEVAEGDFVSFCDDDDAWTPGTAPTVLGFLEDHPGVVVASTWHLVSHPELGTTAVYRGPTEYGVRHLLWQNFVALPFGVIRRGAVPFDIAFDPELPTGEDWDLWLRCAEHGEVRTVTRVGYVYTQHGGSRVTRALQAQIDGRRGFVAKHGAAMSASCRLYHETVLSGYQHGRRGMLSTLSAASGRSPLRAAAVAGLLGSSLAASRAGRRRRDPGLQARLMASLIGRLPGG